MTIDLLRNLTQGKPDSRDRRYTSNGVRPLHAAVLGRQANVVRWLVKQGVSCDPRASGPRATPPFDTPLMIALSYGMADMAVLLIDLGANVNRRSWTGITPLNAAVLWDRDPKVLEALLNHGADPTLKYENKTAVELAAKSQSKHRSRYLELLGCRLK